ncbi:hypothetical protein V6N11_000889 [Hibiscus sabdariffa]|uniref:ATP-grasp fold succinyl-CoA synthetase-type domain-containing protein n=1 Tax=Hibiscus sabdariffa TaxID=183260 RepID=A0ABR2RYT1_9ROSI
MGVRENKVKYDEDIDVKCDSSNVDSEINPERYAVMVSEMDHADLDDQTQGVVASMKEKALVNTPVGYEDQFSVVQFVNQSNFYTNHLFSEYKNLVTSTWIDKFQVKVFDEMFEQINAKFQVKIEGDVSATKTTVELVEGDDPYGFRLLLTAKVDYFLRRPKVLAQEEQYLFYGVKLTEAKCHELRYKDIYELVKKWIEKNDNMGEYKMPKAYEQERVVEQEKIIDVVLQCYTDLIIGDKINLFVGKMLGQIFVTKQTGPQGKVVSKVYLGQKLCLVNEMYFTITPDRNTTDLSIVACSKGETNFEGHIKKYPDMIIKVPIAIFIRITDEDAAKRVDGLTPKVVDRTDSIEQVKKLYKLFYEADCALLEINSLPETSSNQLVDADAKLNFNDNFAFRHKYIYSLCDQSQEDPQEVATAKADLTYTCLHGEISCMVNGVGLAMATMHIIKLRGGTATKFFEVDGNASEGQVVEVIPRVANGIVDRLAKSGILRDGPFVRKAKLLRFFLQLTAVVLSCWYPTES